MKILLEYRDCDKNDEFAQIACLINLAQFFHRCNRLDLYRNYLFKLYELQVSKQAKIEAALALKKIGDSLQFEHVAFSEEWSRTCYPQAITEAEVKELLTSETIDALDEARLRPQAIEQVSEKKERCLQDLNLRGETPLDFKSNALTTRPKQLIKGII